MSKEISTNASGSSQSQPIPINSSPSSSGRSPLGLDPRRDFYSPEYVRLHEDSYYELQCALCKERHQNEYILARDARAQQQNAPYGPLGRKNSAQFHHYNDDLPIRFQHPLRHHSLMFNRTETFDYNKEVFPGAVRSVYNELDPTKFDVIVHDKRLGESKKGHGEFGWAPYVPADGNRSKQATSRGLGRPVEVAEKQEGERVTTSPNNAAREV